MTSPANPSVPGPAATQIHDLGYRAYTGERAGVAWAVRSLVGHGIRQALGLKRPLKHKIVPAIAIFIAYAPAIAMTGFAAFLRAEFVTELLGYGEYFGISGFAQFLFAAAVAPGVMTSDRTNGMLALYLASPLTRSTYVLARGLAIFLVMLIVAIGPIVFLILGYTFAGVGPGGVGEVLEILGRALVAGTLGAALFTGVAMFISSIPRRWGIASIAIVAFFIVSGVVSIGLTEAIDITDWVALGAVDEVMTEAAERIMDDRSEAIPALDALPSAALIAATVVYALVALGATWFRYQRIAVER